MIKIKKSVFILGVVLIGGMSGIIFDRYLFPRMIATKFFSRYAFFKKTAEDVTIINKTEQVFVKEDASVNKIANQVVSSVVNIVSFTTEMSGNKKNSISQPEIKNGTGVVVTSDGLVMTYVKAIFSEKATYKIITSDNRVYDASLVDIDSYSNLAFLKITASNLPAISLGNSDEAVAGEKIIAIGNNSGTYNPFFSAGILGNLDQAYSLSDSSIALSEKLEGVFRTDLNNEENYVGGPVVDYSGQVIGITGSVSHDGKNFFFQIPANKVKAVIDKEIKKELDTNPSLGVYYRTITKAYALANNLPVEFGAQIYSPSGQSELAILKNSPAAGAGLKLNDIITAISGEKIDGAYSLPDLLYRHKKGETVILTILRNNQEMEINVQL